MADAESTSKLRPAYVLISSFAAVAGAFLASRLGVYGTVIGVGVISLVSTLGTDLSLRSLDRTRRPAARTMNRTAELPSSGTVVNPAVPAEGMTATAALADGNAVDADTAELERDSTAPLDPVEGDATAPFDAVEGNAAADADHPDLTERDNHQRGRRLWTTGRIPAIATGAVASFVLALLVITGIESVSGSSLSGGGRTTLGELIVDGGNSPDSEDTDSDDVDAPGQPVPTPEPTTPSPTVTDPPDGGEQGVIVPPGEEAPDVEQPADPELPSPSPTESPTSEPTEPPADGAGD